MSMKKILLITLIGLFGMAAKAQDTLGCPLEASFTYSVSGGNLYLTNTSTDEPTWPFYFWTVDGSTSYAENPIFPTAGFEGSEEVCLTVSDSSEECIDMICMILYFDEDSVIVDDSLGCDLNASFTYSISGGEITFTNTSTGEPVDAMYNWAIDDLT
jgi:PKD repeat protein